MRVQFGVHACDLAACVLFAAFFYAEGEACYETDEFDFAQMIWLSVHTFTTVGFGSVFPTCAGGHLIVLAEQYVALVSSSFAPRAARNKTREIAQHASSTIPPLGFRV